MSCEPIAPAPPVTKVAMTSTNINWVDEQASNGLRPSEEAGNIRRVAFFGAPLDVVSMDEAVAVATRAVMGGLQQQHACLSSRVLARLQDDEQLREVFWTFDLVTADGQGVVWGARLFGYPVPERVSGIDLMEALLAVAAANHYRVFLLGAAESVLLKAAAVIRARYPALEIVGAHHGYFSAEEEDAIVTAIAASSVDLLFVALPTPAKELFLARNWARLNVAFAMGIGGSLDVLAGLRWRAPRWVQRIGMEWLARVIQEPRRLGPSLLRGNSRFVMMIAAELFRTRVGGHRSRHS